MLRQAMSPLVVHLAVSGVAMKLPIPRLTTMVTLSLPTTFEG